MPKVSGGTQHALSRPWKSWKYKVGLAVIAVGGFIIRANYVLTVRSPAGYTHGDSFLFYWWPAQQLAKGRGFISPATVQHCTWNPNNVPREVLLNLPDHLFNLCQVVPSAKHPPGFVTLLAGLDKLGINGMETQRYLMCALGSITVVLVGILAARLISGRAGIIAAVIAAVYPNTWINDTALWSETLMSFGFVLGLLGVYAFWRTPNWKRLLVASIGFTIAMSARSEMIVLFAAVFIPLVLARSILAWKKRIALLALAAIAPLAVVIPWSLYNASRFEDPVLLSTGLGPTALASTCGHVYYTSSIGYYSLKCMKNTPKPVPASMGLDESQVNSYDKQRALDYAKAHPGRTVLTVVAREGRLLELWNPHQQNVFNHYAQGRGSMALVTTAQWGFRVLAILSIVGAVLWRRRRIPLYPLMAEIGLTVVVVAVTFGSTRYRAAAEWCLIVLAATTLDWLVSRFSTWRGKRRWRADTGSEDGQDVGGAQPVGVSGARDPGPEAC